MLALSDIADSYPCLKVVTYFHDVHGKKFPRIFFMDTNIKDLRSFDPYVSPIMTLFPITLPYPYLTSLDRLPSRFTHIYSFNIGMPEDVAQHILSMINNSLSVK